jgi:hypothetical protein
VLFDRSDVVSAASELAEGGLAERVRAVGGDFFSDEGLMPAADVYMLKWILHDWSDERCLAILRHIRAASGGGRGGRRPRLLVVENFLPESATAREAGMWVMYGGRDRTIAEYSELLEAAGFTVRRTTKLCEQSKLVTIEADVPA